MSVVNVQVGQAGNQVGSAFYNVLYEDRQYFLSKGKSSRSEISFSDMNDGDAMLGTDIHFDTSCHDGTLRSRAVMIDMESKVVDSVRSKLNAENGWKFPEGQCLTRHTGSGNNWAFGYSGQGEETIEASIDAVQRETEKCDRLDGLMLMMSVAGGTGSGMGTRLTEQLRDTYEHNAIMNHVIWPYSSGEVAVQNYNAVLTMSRLYKVSDAIIVYENDALHNMCSKLLPNKKRNISFESINAEIAKNMAGALGPKFESPHGQTGLSALIRNLCAHPDYKALNIKTVPQMSESSRSFATYEWKGMLRNLRQMQIVNSFAVEGMNWRATPATLTNLGEHNTAISDLLILRGLHAETAPIDQFQTPDLFVPWATDPLSVWRHPAALAKYDKSATLVSNNRAIWNPFDIVTSRAWSAFASKAFLHQYEKFGFSEDEFVECFIKMEQVIKSYRDL